jgi:gamma-glutamyltranspeptidase
MIYRDGTIQRSHSGIVEAERRAYADRSFFLGDPDENSLKALMDDTISNKECPALIPIKPLFL